MSDDGGHGVQPLAGNEWLARVWDVEATRSQKGKAERWMPPQAGDLV